MHFLITAGGTKEYIDPVRFISNASSGKTGIALTRAAINAGHKVTLITASITLLAPAKTKVIKAETAAEMFTAVKKYLPKCDCLIMAAAVSDYTIAQPSKTKLKKNDQPLTLKLKPTTDILKWAAAHKKNNQLITGFALEDKAIRSRAEKKLKEKKLDMIIANTPSAIGADNTNVQIKIPNKKWLKLPQAEKTTTAKKIIALIEKLYSHSNT